MTTNDHNPATSLAVIIRYLRTNPDKNKIVEKVKGEKEAVKTLKKLNAEESEPKKYGYLWRWENPQAALEYQLKKLNK